MIKYIEFGVVIRSAADVSAPLKRLFPEEFSGRTLRVVLQDGDPRICKLREILNEGGMRPHNDGVKYKRYETYTLRTQYAYSEVDFARADYFGFFPHHMAWTKKLGDNRFGVQINDEEVHPAGSPSGHVAGFKDGWGLVVSPSFMAEVENRGLVGPTFRETVPYLDTTPSVSMDFTESTWDKSSHGPWIQMDCEVVLPPVHPSVRLTDFRTEEVVERGENDRIVVRKDGAYPHAELHYLRNEIEQVEPFDMARTLERFSPIYEVADRGGTLVFSRKFYDLCKEWGVEATWAPYFVHDD